MSNPEQKTTDYISVKEMAALLHIGKNKAYKLVNIKGFPVIKIGGTHCVSKKGLEEWIEKNYGSEISLDD